MWEGDPKSQSPPNLTNRDPRTSDVGGDTPRPPDVGGRTPNLTHRDPKTP